MTTAAAIVIDPSGTDALAQIVADVGYPADLPLALLARLADGRHWAYTAGTAPNGAAITTRHRFYAASVSKQITAGGIALLVQDGVLTTDDTVGRWLPELPSWTHDIRLHHLLHHTSGLPAGESVEARVHALGDPNWTTPSVMAVLQAWDAADGITAPGSTYAYSNVAYICLAQIIERASGLPLHDFAEARIFTPLGMHDSAYWSGPEAFPAGERVVPMVLTEYGAPLTLGDGGIWTTVEDLTRWNESLLPQVDTLGITTLLHTTTPYPSGAAADYAWGIRLYEHRGYAAQSHGGAWMGVNAKVVRLPQLRAGTGAGAGAHFAFQVLKHDTDRVTALTDRVLDLLINAATDTGTGAGTAEGDAAD